MNPIQTIVVPYDFSKHSEAALAVASELAQELGAELHLLHIIRPSVYLYPSEFNLGVAPRDSYANIEDEFRHRLEEAAVRSGSRPDRTHVHVVESTNIARSIDSEAERLGADLIAMGTHGRTGLAHVLMGSIAEATTRRAPCPVMTVPCESEASVATAHWEASRHPPAGSF